MAGGSLRTDIIARNEGIRASPNLEYRNKVDLLGAFRGAPHRRVHLRGGSADDHDVRK